MNFFVKTLLKQQLKNLPADQVEMILAIIEKNPEFFTKIAGEIQEKTKTGLSQQDAAMAVMKEHEAELKEIMSK